MELWLDDKRDPEQYGKEDWLWAMNADDAIQALLRGDITCASFDYDLGLNSRTGYDVVVWLELHPKFWPPDGVRVHSQNRVERSRMETVIRAHYGRVCEF